MAHGVTNSGKTHTMFGRAEDPGIIPRSLEQICARGDARWGALRLSVVEVAEGKLYNLVNKRAAMGRISEDSLRSAGRVFEAGGRSGEGEGEGEGEGGGEGRGWQAGAILGAIGSAMKRRQVRQTALNETSSRSSVVITITLERGGGGGDRERGASLRFVDLGGTERTKDAVTSGQSFNQGRHINQDVSALFQCLRDLRLGKSALRYRERALTKLLFESFGRQGQGCGGGAGGKRLVTLVSCVNPSAGHYHSTCAVLENSVKARGAFVAVSRQQQVTSAAYDYNGRPVSERDRAHGRALRALRSGLSLRGRANGAASGGAWEGVSREELLQRITELEEEKRRSEALIETLGARLEEEKERNEALVESLDAVEDQLEEEEQHKRELVEFSTAKVRQKRRDVEECEEEMKRMRAWHEEEIKRLHEHYKEESRWRALARPTDEAAHGEVDGAGDLMRVMTAQAVDEPSHELHEGVVGVSSVKDGEELEVEGSEEEDESARGWERGKDVRAIPSAKDEKGQAQVEEEEEEPQQGDVSPLFHPEGEGAAGVEGKKGREGDQIGSGSVPPSPRESNGESTVEGSGGKPKVSERKRGFSATRWELEDVPSVSGLEKVHLGDVPPPTGSPKRRLLRASTHLQALGEARQDGNSTLAIGRRVTRQWKGCSNANKEKGNSKENFADKRRVKGVLPECCCCVRVVVCTLLS
ncbi:unnamed protein product [Discosporangium mesarthrocarpum]